ncbi:MAG: YhcH/YjgK/YiaL family protein [Eubacteriales bacterium]|nr:YhcH/YjgK/YiaL family protein [Eubacteriales bacterium]
MVIDRIDHAAQYYALGKGIETVLRWFATYEDEGLALPAKTVLDGERIFINGVNYTSEAKPQGQLEAHHKYIDVMYVVEGEERFFYKPIAEVTKIAMPYDAEKECALAEIDADAAQHRFSAGHFLIFFPQDGHLAAQLWDQPAKVRKFIAKVAVATL